MSEDRITKVILSNMCMLYKDDEYLIINRTKSDWPGLSFPGGHVEDGETLEESIIREMKEETGLDIKNPRLVGIKDWPWGNNVRYFALLYVSNEFEGEIVSSKEGEDFWLIRDNCHTELEPEEDGRTLTVIGFKPIDSEIIDKIGRKYHLYV